MIKINCIVAECHGKRHAALRVCAETARNAHPEPNRASVSFVIWKTVAIVILSEAKNLALSFSAPARSRFTTGCESAARKRTMNQLPIECIKLRARSFASLRMTVNGWLTRGVPIWTTTPYPQISRTVNRRSRFALRPSANLVTGSEGVIAIRRPRADNPSSKKPS
jgi:hypothetical protein